MSDILQSIRSNNVKLQNSVEKTVGPYQVAPLSALSEGNGEYGVFSTPTPLHPELSSPVFVSYDEP